MAKRKVPLQSSLPSASTKRRKADGSGKKINLSPIEALEQEFIEIGEMDVDKLVLAAKSIFDSARRCLKGGKKRRVIQSDSKEVENAGVGWKVNFRTIMKHIREKTHLENSEIRNESKAQELDALKTELEKKIPENEIKTLPVTDIMKTVETKVPTHQSPKAKSTLRTVNESTMRKIWNCLSFSRCFPMNENEMAELEDLEISKFIHYSLPKNEWYFGKFWFNKAREDVIEELKNRKKGRNTSAASNPKTGAIDRKRESDSRKKSLAVLTELKMQIMHSKLQNNM